ncbi:MAG TPA: outer membrane lipoprotein LolB [Alcaligenes sp.]|nr:outer membrane lipoprotein LolB [Alcaligenes sp.]HRL27268.1 outer membrane lipoprotein LolB [Alcaligenes sp.]
MSCSLLRRWAGLGALALTGLLAACATPQKIDAPARTEQAQRDTALSRAGRFALSVTHDNGQVEAVQGGFAWRDDGQRLMLDLTNPLGNTLARVWVVPGRAMLERTDGSQEAASHPDELVEKVLGSPVPVAGLRDWLHGRTGAAPVRAQKRDDQEHLSSFEQAGWRVGLSRYDERGPRLLQLNRHEASRSISVRLVVDQ